jgi:hypothetical protein
MEELMWVKNPIADQRPCVSISTSRKITSL